MSSAIEADLVCTVRASVEWLTRKAFPLWSERGFDSERGVFHERLDFSLSPVRGIPERLMVQARQISVFSAAALAGDFSDGAELAIRAAESMIDRYEQADGRPGWVFSVESNGAVVDATRDLYGHAFALFGLAWIMRVDDRPKFRNAVDRTVDFLDIHMADSVWGGFLDSLPNDSQLRHQNPHMHLFEAFIALYESTGEDRFLSRCEDIRQLAVKHFLSQETGFLREVYHHDWSVAPEAGQGIVEPGHLFEWSWLLQRYQGVSRKDQSPIISRMLEVAIHFGLDKETGRIVDQIGESGQILSATSRSWPHAEALKALTLVPIESGGGDIKSLQAILRRFLKFYCRDGMGGGWQDQLNEMDGPLRSDIPASSFYHIYFAIKAIQQFSLSHMAPLGSGRAE